MKKENRIEEYNEKIENIMERLNTSPSGLSEDEAQKRLQKYGENKLKERAKKSNLQLFFEQFCDFMVILLIFASLFSAGISYIRNESYIDSIIIIIIVIINAILSFIQERKADLAISELNKMFVTNNRVIRNGIKKNIDVRNIVVGDIIELEAGDYISTDGRIINTDFLEVNESTLTGESIRIKKNSAPLTGEKELYERKNMVFAGCNVINGHALVVVTKTGMDTELGKIASSLINKKSELTPLQKKVNKISKMLTYAILIIIIVMMIIGLLLKNDFFDVLMLSISLAVAAIPEGMSSVITIILSLGMTSMAKKNVIIRKMSSVETLGSTDVICSDKTGTITQNKMVVQKIFVNDKLYNSEDNITDDDILNLCASMCHNITKNNETYLGDETEVAIYKYLEQKNKLQTNPRIKEYPFDSERKMMSTINKVQNKDYSFTKGSLESIISNCSQYEIKEKQYSMTKEYQEKILAIAKEQSEKSLRLLAFAYKKDHLEDPEKNMIFLGLIGMMDPPRDTVYEAISTCQKSGIKPVMITGDSMLTATSIAQKVGIISTKDKAIEGKIVDKMTDEELQEAVKKYQVYARISPNTKLRIVDSLQKQGLIVAMTGDGVNDAPAIQKADIGIGMGITGTEVVKKVADCILVDDSFSTIVDGVEEGRRITSNIKKVILYLLAGNIVEVILVFISMLLNMEMLLWLNLITDSIPAIMLAFEKSDKDIMENTKDNHSNTTFFTPFLSAKIIIGAILKSTIMIVMFFTFCKIEDINTASSLMFIYLIAHELLYAFSCRNLKHSVLNKRFLENKKLSIGVGIITIIQILVLTTPIKKFFIVNDIQIKYVVITLLICFITFAIGEYLKPLYAKLFKDYTEVPNEK